MPRGFSPKCIDCFYFSYADVPKSETMHDYPTQRKDGWCNKVFPRGYTNAGKKGGYCWSGKSACFQLERRDEDQVTIEEVTA